MLALLCQLPKIIIDLDQNSFHSTHYGYPTFQDQVLDAIDIHLDVIRLGNSQQSHRVLHRQPQGLKFKNLFLLILGLFVLDLLVPDMVPMIDEIILGLLAILLANLKKEESQVDQNDLKGNVIEGEVIKEDEKTK